MTKSLTQVSRNVGSPLGSRGTQFGNHCPSSSYWQA